MSKTTCELVNFVNFYVLLLNCFCKGAGFAMQMGTPPMSIHKVHKFTETILPFLRLKNGQKWQKSSLRCSYDRSECVLLVLWLTYRGVRRSFAMGNYRGVCTSCVLV